LERRDIGRSGLDGQRQREKKRGGGRKRNASLPRHVKKKKRKGENRPLRKREKGKYGITPSLLFGGGKRGKRKKNFDLPSKKSPKKKKFRIFC